MREAILQIARHFLQVDPKLNTEISLVADYSMESHAADHDNYINVSKNRKRRAKALLGTFNTERMRDLTCRCRF